MGIFFFAILFPFINVYAEQPEIILKSQSKLWLSGDSTLHPYSSTATVINFSGTIQSKNPASSLVEKLSQSDVLTFKVTIPVENLKSGEKGLDKNMYKALKSHDFPTIEFRLTDKKLLPISATTGVNKLTSNGVLSIAGKENPIQIDSQYEILPEGIHIFGAQHLLMTDYGVKPPTIMAIIKVKNDVIIHFDLVLGY